MIMSVVNSDTKEMYYTYEEAASIVGASYARISDAVSKGTLTGVKLPHDSRKYVLKSEVDAIAGLGRVASKEAKTRIEAVRKNAAPRDYVAEEFSYGAKAQLLVEKIDSLDHKMDKFETLFDDFKNVMAAYVQQAIPLFNMFASLAGESPKQIDRHQDRSGAH